MKKSAEDFWLIRKNFSEDNLKKAGITRRYQNDDKVRCKEEIVEVIRDGKL